MLFFEKDYGIGNLSVGRDDIVSKMLSFEVARIYFFRRAREFFFPGGGILKLKLADFLRFIDRFLMHFFENFKITGKVKSI